MSEIECSEVNCERLSRAVLEEGVLDRPNLRPQTKSAIEELFLRCCSKEVIIEEGSSGEIAIAFPISAGAAEGVGDGSALAGPHPILIAIAIVAAFIILVVMVETCRLSPIRVGGKCVYRCPSGRVVFANPIAGICPPRIEVRLGRTEGDRTEGDRSI